MIYTHIYIIICIIIYIIILIYIEDTSLHLIFAARTNGEGAQELGVSTIFGYGTYSFCVGNGVPEFVQLGFGNWDDPRRWH
jgi:hypothetical protein